MATIGQQLLQPESGWKRYDDSHSAIVIPSSWLVTTANATHYNGTISYTDISNSKAVFKFKGSKLRLISRITVGASTATKISIDGVVEEFNQQNSNVVNQALVYEKLGLTDAIHTVEIWNETPSTFIYIDAIDIDLTGRMIHPQEVLNINELEVGKRIRCNYKASSGQVGTFSKIGEETYVDGNNDFIPPTSSATPNGDFYFIMVEDWNGKKRLVADRNIQHSISWDTLNASGIASGSGLPLTSLSEEPTVENGFNRKKYAVRLLTGGTTSTDKDNEWDKYIVGSNLGGTITVGDNAVWNWNSLWTWTSTVINGTPTSRITKGNALVSNTNAYPTNRVNIDTAFRPVLEEYVSEKININKTLILHDGEYKTYELVEDNFKEINITPTMTASNLPSPYVVTSSSEYTSVYPAWKIFTPESTNRWISLNEIRPVGGHWVKIDLGVARKIIKIELKSQAAVGNDIGLKTWELYGSNDDNVYDMIASNVHLNNPELQVYNITNDNKYKYYRINMLDNYTTTSNINTIVYMNLFEFGTKESWSLVSSNIPTITQFVEKGLDDLPIILERKVTTLEPHRMIQDSTPVGNGKVYRKKVDLNKYFDIKTISTETRNE